MSQQMMQQQKSWISLILVILGSFSTAGAEEMQLSLLTESEYLGEVPTIVSASKMPQLQSEAPAAVTVIDAETIRASGARNIVDLMLLVPGFQVGNFNSGQPVVTYHGLADQYPRHMQVLVDGRSVYSPMFRGAFWTDLTIAIDDIERIEVIRGPNTVTYGSNAFFGVINIITLHASQQSGTFVKGVLGSNGIRDATVRQVWHSGEHSFRLTGAWREDKGFEARYDDVQAQFLNFTGDIRLGSSDTLEIDIGINQNTYIEDFIDGSVSILPATEKVNSHYQQVRWHSIISQSQEFHLQFFHQYRDQVLNTVTDPIDFSFLGLGVVTAPLSFNATEHRYDFEFQHNLRPSANFQFVWGAGARLDEMNSQSFFGDDRVRENRVRRLFSNVEWHAASDLIFNAGAIYEDSDVAGDDVSPRLAVNYHLAWGDTIRASVSEATRMPALIEQEGSQQYWLDNYLIDQVLLGTGGLVTEKITTHELAYLGRINKANLSWGLRLYRDKITDRITEIAIPVVEVLPEREAYSFANTGIVEVTGQELELDYRPIEKLRVLLNYARMQEEVYGFDPSYTLGQREPVIERSVPGYSAQATIMYQFAPEWQATLLGSRVDEMEWLGDGDFIGAQNRIDLNILKEFRFNNTTSRLTFTAQLNDGDFADFRFVNLVSRKYYLTVDTQF